MDKSSTVANTTYSTLVRYPSFNYKKLYIWIVAVQVFINLPSIINYFYLNSFYYDLELAIKSSASINIASTSVYIETSIMYARTL